MNILFIHGNYPGQFRTLAAKLGNQSSHHIVFLTARNDETSIQLAGVNIKAYEDIELPPYISNQFDKNVSEPIKRGIKIQEEIISLINNGFIPRLVIFHGGNGLGLFIKDLLPNAAIVGYFEWYFSRRDARNILGNDNLNSMNLIRSRNLTIDNELIACTSAITPTKWQASQFPKVLQEKINVVFDGIDRSFFYPDESQSTKQESIRIEGEHDSCVINPDDILVTYATRGMEPLRGFPNFVELLPELFNRIPKLKVLIGGRDRSAYGPEAPSHGGSWKEKVFDEIGPFAGQDKIVFTGLMDYSQYRKMLWRTNLHCYFTQPYVTSWSLFEAVACGSPILTNISEATTGTIEINHGIKIPEINSLKEASIIQLIVNKLKQPNTTKLDCLEERFSLENTNKEWEKHINDALTKTRQPS